MQNETSNATIFGHIGEMTESDYKDSGNQDITIQNLMDMSFMQGYEIVGIHNQFLDKTDLGRLRYGDLNVDGHPDLFFTLEVLRNGVTETKNMILLNTVCTLELCNEL